MTEDQTKETLVSDSLAEDIRMIESMSFIPGLLNVVCKTTGMRFAAVARVTDKKWITCLTQDEISFGLKPGDELKLETTICHEIRQRGNEVIIDNVSEDLIFKDHHTPAMYGFQSYISVPIVTKDGEFFGTLCAIDPSPNKLDTPEIRTMFNLFTDLISFHITAGQQARKAEKLMLREREMHKVIEANEQKLNIVVDASELGIFDVNLLSREISFSEQYLKVFGRAADERPHWDDFRDQIHKDDLAGREDAFNTSYETGRFSYSCRIFWSDNSMHWIESKGKVFFDENKKPVSITGTVRDITAERNFAAMLEGKVRDRTKELMEKNDELERMNKELESFAYISGHDLQEPLRKIQSFISLLEADENSGMSEKEKDYFNRMKNAASRMQMLISDLLAYSRATTAERIFEQTDLVAVVEKIKEDMREELHQKNAVIEMKGLCTLHVIPFQMRQLFDNLISNSIKFASQERSPVIKIEASEATPEELKKVKLPAEKKFCHIQFSDNGIGFENEYSERVFELFQRLNAKAAYIGTGIGLAIVKKIAEIHNGAVVAEGKSGEGAVFNIYLPQE